MTVVTDSSGLSHKTPPEKKTDTKLVRGITAFFDVWARFVANNSIALIVICNILSILGTIKIATTPNENDITGYTPYGARARDEFDVMTDFFSRNGNGIAEFVLILPKKGQNALSKDVLEEALRIEEMMTSKFTMRNANGDQQNYRQFCHSFCQINDPFVQFARTYLAESGNLGNSTASDDRIHLDYPISKLFSREMNIQPYFFGVEMDHTSANKISNLQSAKMIALQLRAERVPGWTTQTVKDFEMDVTNFFEKNFSSPSVRVLTLSTSYVESEVVRAGMSLLPFLVVGFVIMAIISSITTYLSALYMQQVSIHKLSLALAACICPFMACGTALGALFICGVRFDSILCVTPFLVLAIGVDDSYLMIHTWQRVTAQRRRHPVAGDSAASRLAEVLADTGPAILISALTNILADTAGTFTSSPAVALLAYGNMACLLMDFLYQITFYSAIMVIAGDFEMRKEAKHVIACGIDDESQTSSTSFHDRVKHSFSAFLDKYVSLLTNIFFQLFVIFVWMSFLAVSIFGITKMDINLTPKKLFALDSSLQEMDDLRVQYVIPHYFLATVFVSSPGNLSDPSRVARLDKFVADFEKIPGSWGSNTTQYFLRDFKEFDSSIKETEESSRVGLDVNNIPMFLDWPEYTFWRGFLRYHNQSSNVVLDKFFITFAFHGDRLKEWMQRNEMLKKWRRVIDEYKSEFNVSVYSDDGIYLDLIDNMPTDSWQSALATLLCMSLVCFVFLCDFTTVFVTSAAIASIMTGILGMLSLTGTDLDPIVMSALIISIGFSVDVPAHISYHYHTSDRHDTSLRVRLRHTLASVGFPALQASLSTSLCVLALKFTELYMSNVFSKTMLLCMVLCVLHGLVLIPVLVSFFHPIVAFINSKLRK